MARAAPAIAITPLADSDFSDWLTLWDGNNGGKRDPLITTETWRRLLDPATDVHGLAARIDGHMAGLVHYILHPVTGHIRPVCYMQDLYVGPDFRRRGVGRALVEYLAALGKKEQWGRLYWLAENKNEAAQALYKGLGIKLDFSLHVLPL